MAVRTQIVALALVLVLLAGFVPVFVECLRAGESLSPCEHCAGTTHSRAMDSAAPNSSGAAPCCTLKSTPAPAAAPQVQSSSNSEVVQPHVVAQVVPALPIQNLSVGGTFVSPVRGCSPALLCKFLI